MADFAYQAFTSEGKKVSGSMVADSVNSALEELKRVGLTPLKVAQKSVLSSNMNLSFLKKKPKPRDLAVFCRQFTSILDAGVPVVSALGILSEQSENKMLGEIIGEVKLSVEKGQSLTDSLRPHAKIFGGGMFLSLMSAGEESGSLTTSLERMAVQYDKEMKLKNVIRKASIYPIIIIILLVAVIMIMLAVVIPQFQDIFEQTGGELPGITKAVVAASGFMQKWWWAVFIGIILVVIGLISFNKTPAGKEFYSRLILKIPVVSKLSVKIASARMARTLSTLIGSGIPLIAALDITTDTMTNVLFRNILKDAKNGVSLGNALSDMLKKGELFPPLVYQMVKIGEESGNSEEMLTKIADYYDDEVEATTEQVMALIEPTLIIIMGAIVAVIVLSIMLPVAAMYDNLENI